MRLIHVAGLSSGVGKTAVLAALARGLPGLAALKLSPGDGPAELVVQAGRLARPGSDTARLLEAGAAPVAWLRGDRSRLHELWPAALEALAASELIAVEGNVLARFARPQLRLLVARVGLEQIKPSAAELLDDVDVWVLNRESSCDGTVVEAWRERMGPPWSGPDVIVVDAEGEAGAAPLIEAVVTWTRS